MQTANTQCTLVCAVCISHPRLALTLGLQSQSALPLTPTEPSTSRQVVKSAATYKMTKLSLSHTQLIPCKMVLLPLFVEPHHAAALISTA
jgi:hypothetical protein